MNKLTLLLAALFASSATAESSIASEMKNLWNTWKTLHNKVYTQSEDYERFSIFSQNYLTVINYNKKNNGVKLALNQFADLSDAEFKAQYTSGLLNDEPKAQNFEPEIDYSLLALPTTVDWRKKGAVNPVKNQAKCGSCWAFAAASALESLHFQKTGKLLSFSEQQLVDCDQVSHGCNGGSSRNGFNLVAEQGIELEADYPYEAKDAECRYDASKAIRVNSGYKDVKPRNPTALKVAVAIRPVYVSVQADQPAFRFYSSGVLKEDCDTGLNHAVLAVGFTQVDGEDAFIVRNSWTENWGTEGYIHLSASGKINQGAGVCGMLIRPAYPIA